ncbi:hypothetical protein R83H12_01964 [Fibrobacteria bacterium R8-3-H12]
MNKTNEKYSWNPEKREQNIKERGLDIVYLAPKIFADPNLVVKQDFREDYNEERFLAFAFVDDLRLCLCYTLREDKAHLITIFKMHKKDWEEQYGKNS